MRNSGEFMEEKFISYKELMQRLNATPKQLEKVWREWPHILVGRGNTLRQARFNYKEVLDYLKKNAKNSRRR